MTLSEGQILNERYRITRLVSQSDFGASYQAWDQNSNLPCLLEEIEDASEAARQVFARQAGQMYKLSHPGLPHILEAFSVSGQGLYLVLQYIEGQDLQAIFDQMDGPLSTELVLPAALQVLDALSYLHAQVPLIVHGDITPSKIILTGQPEDEKNVLADGAVLVGLGVGTKFDSSTGAITGTRAISPGFSPPESYGKGQIDQRSDIYALGASLYYLLAGKRLPESVLIRGKDVQPPKAPHEFNPRLPQALSLAIMQAIQIEPAARFSTAGEFKQALLGSPPAALPAVAPAKKPKAGLKPVLLVAGVLVGLFILALIVGSGMLVSRYLTALNATDTLPPPSPTFTIPASATLPPTATTASPTLIFTATLPPAPTGLASTIEDGQGVPMALVPSGEFLMGSDLGGVEESPEHTVFLSDYYIDLYEVTNARYAECVGAGVCDPPTQFNSATRPSYYDNPDFAEFPVALVTWAMAGQYCSWRGASLPTEAQWEKAARGSDFRVFPWQGEIADCSLANFWNNEPGCQRDTTAVGSYLAGVSPFGLYDMAGNLWEWVLDWFDPGYYSVSPADNPAGPASGEYRVVRGGSFPGGVGQIRVTTRGRNLPQNGYNYVGFRCARLAP